MGIVGEPIIGSTSRLNILRKDPAKKETKAPSLDSRLPQINNRGIGEYGDGISSVANKNQKLIDVYKSNNKLRQNKYNMMPNYRYKNVSFTLY